MKRVFCTFSFITLFIFCPCVSGLFAQIDNTGTLSNGKKTNNIKTAVPFLLISPDARAGAMGDVGAATSPDAYALHWNPAKLAFLESAKGLSISYSPWLKNLVPDIDFAYLTYYHRLDERNMIAGSIRYFSLGDIQLTDADQADLGVYSPNEFALDLAFSRQFGSSFSLGTAMRYIRSGLSNGQFYQGEQLRSASAFAADVSAYFKKKVIAFNADADLSLGLNISNIGTKMSYAQGGSKYFLPTNLRLGTALSIQALNKDRFTLALDLNKLLVPTSPEYENGVIVKGKNPDRSVVSGIFGSFSDAPGGFAEEMKEISYALGTEYEYNAQFAIRAGYFYESPSKGDRQFFTLGTGLYADKFNLDLAYIIASQTKSPLANTLRFSLAYQLQKTKK
ncbi:MAG: type IX secretion system outer membrane channel protein PorV [Sphingobacteriaceae bacterium]